MDKNKLVYEPLQVPHAFRLLELLPGTSDDEISCELNVANLALRPEYYVTCDKENEEDL
jgi:hypothetical protein